jgi:hypothetical protein
VASPHDSVEFVDEDHFSIYFLHDPLDFVFTFAENSANIEYFLIFSRSRRRERETENKLTSKKRDKITVFGS